MAAGVCVTLGGGGVERKAAERERQRERGREGNGGKTNVRTQGGGAYLTVGPAAGRRLAGAESLQRRRATTLCVK